MAFWRRGGEFGTRTPVETREMVTRSRESEARIPVVQSSWASLALVAIGASALMFVTAAGPAVFWGIAAVVMATTFVWTLSFGGDLETQIEFERADGAVEIETVYGPTARTWASAAFGAAFVGFLAHCVARFLDILGLTFPTWFAKPAAVLSVFFFIFSASFLAHVEMRFVQDLMYVSFHLEEALAHVLEALGLREVKRPRPVAQAQPRVIDRGRRVATNGRAVAQEALGVTAEELETVPNEPDAETMDAMEFLVAGQRIEENGKPILYSRTKWKGRKLSSGTTVTERKARGWAELLAEIGILEDYAGKGFDLSENLSLGEALDSFVVAKDITIPPPRQLAEWGRM